MKTEHIVFRNSGLFCTKCGEAGEFGLPMAVGDVKRKMKAFSKDHQNCKQTWVQPEADQSKSITEKAYWWMVNGEHGMSSETMWKCFMCKENFAVNHPHDPDDFKRCYLLLETIPEWKERLDELKPLSKTWSNLVDNWDELTRMYELNVSQDWKNHKSIGMYELMRKCIVN